MAERKPEWAEVGNLVTVSIETVDDYRAYAKLNAFHKPALLHFSEISSSIIRSLEILCKMGTFRRGK